MDSVLLQGNSTLTLPGDTTDNKGGVRLFAVNLTVATNSSIHSNGGGKDRTGPGGGVNGGQYGGGGGYGGKGGDATGAAGGFTYGNSSTPPRYII